MIGGGLAAWRRPARWRRAATRSSLLRAERLARRQGGRAARRTASASTWGRPSSRCPRSCGAIFAEAGRDLGRRARPGPARPAVAVASSTTARRSTCVADAEADGRRARRRSPRAGAAAGLPAVPRPLRAAARRSPSASSSGGRSARSATCSTRGTTFQPSTLARRARACAWAARVAGDGPRPRARRRASRRCSTTSRSTSARPPTPRRPCSAASPTCRRARASGIRAAAPRAVPEALAGLARELGVELRTGRRRAPHPARRRRRPWRASRPTTASAIAAGRRRLQRRRRADAPRAARRHAGGPALRAPAPLRAGLLGRRALPRPRPPLRPPAAPQLRLLARPARGVRRHLPPGRAGPRPDLLRLRPGRAPSRTSPRPAARRSTSWSTRPTCGRTTTGSGCCPPTARRSSTSWRGRPAWTTSEQRIRFERRLTPAGHPRPLPRAQRRDLRPGQPRPCSGAFKPANRSPDVPGLYLAGGAAHPGPGMPMVLMSGWIAADALDRDGVVRSAPAARRVAEIGAGRSTADGTRPPIPRSDQTRMHGRCREPAAVGPAASAVLPPVLRALPARRHFHAVRLSRAAAARADPRRRPADRRAEPPVVVGPADRPACSREPVPGPRPLTPRSTPAAWQVPLLRAARLLRRRAGTAARRRGVPRAGAGDPRAGPDTAALDHGPGPVRRPARPAGAPAAGRRPPRRHGSTAASSCRWPSSTRSGTSAARRRWPASARRSRSATAGPRRRRLDRRIGGGAGGGAGRPRRGGAGPRPARVRGAARRQRGRRRRLRPWRRLQARLRGERFRPEHGDEVRRRRRRRDRSACAIGRCALAALPCRRCSSVATCALYRRRRPPEPNARSAGLGADPGPQRGGVDPRPPSRPRWRAGASSSR